MIWIDMNHVWRSRNISANLLPFHPFLFTVFTCTVSLKARAACSPCSVVCFDLFRVNSFHPSPCAWTPDTWWEETKGRRFCTDPLNIWPCLRILCGIWCCCKAVWPQHGKKNADVSHIQWTASQLMKTSHYRKNQQKHSEMWTLQLDNDILNQVHRALILWPCCFQSVASMWRALASPRYSFFFCFEKLLVKLFTTEAIGKKETRVTKAQAAILLIQYRISITGRSK